MQVRAEVATTTTQPSRCDPDDDIRDIEKGLPPCYNELARLGFRACAFLREKRAASTRVEDQRAVRLLRDVL